MFKDDAMDDWLLTDLAGKGFEHADDRRVFYALLIHNSVEKLQLLAFIVEALNLIPVVDFDHVLFICLRLDYLVEANALCLWFA